MSSPRKITAILVAKPGKAEALANLLREMTTPSRSEPGNLRWDVWLDQSDANRFVLDEPPPTADERRRENRRARAIRHRR